MPAAPNTRGGVSDEDGAGEDARKWSWHGEIIAEPAAAQQVLQGDQLETVTTESVHFILVEPQLNANTNAPSPI